MIRFPERSHASTTPGARSGAQHVEPNYQENESSEARRAAYRHYVTATAARQPAYDFAGIEAAMGARMAR